ncbi:DNA-binding protein [Sphingopyxis lindanitolerans]|jgi:hypothetical protein|uniref:DNA-binding protein n=1 Tax=Sphingopyxis lindanitolerans TaxID=2054227 RepID=A0A2S8B0H9_9SPHN|nr:MULTISPECIES: helix-turn-helix domain-containing protein [Sphingopyxis]MBJ7499306.1 helix-turn-helix domain-containing protein [Sphingopyxis sp.]PQM25905.1 DNA-binding protein [Sphingopyxis lindanitolerans]
MSDFAAPIVPRFLKTPDAAVHLGLSARTLEKHRCYGTGPVYRKLGGRIVYAMEDLNAWAEIGRRHSTSDPGKGTILPARPVQR